MNHTDFKLSPIENSIMSMAGILYDEKINQLLFKNELRDVLSSGQLISKFWLLTQFKKLPNIKNVLICGGWFGLLARILYEDNPQLSITSLDIDARATAIAYQLLLGRGNAITGDMAQFDYTSYDCIINTSLEHIPSTKQWISLIKPGTYCIVQSNNAKTIDGHINCHNSIQHLKDDLKLSEYLYADEIEFPMYTRYMVIGRK
jgi:hypothetical protein